MNGRAPVLCEQNIKFERLEKDTEQVGNELELS
jgi:hypothetical protein